MSGIGVHGTLIGLAEILMSIVKWSDVPIPPGVMWWFKKNVLLLKTQSGFVDEFLVKYVLKFGPIWFSLLL